MLFSDSRQAAAFFAPYLETSYETLQHRRLILDGLQRAAVSGEVGVGDLAYHVVKAADEAHVFPRKMTAQERQRETALWVMQELVTLEDRQSLEGRGLMRVNLGGRGWQLPKGLTALGLDETEALDLLAELIRGVRQQGAITMPEGVAANNEVFAPRLGPIYVRGDWSGGEAEGDQLAACARPEPAAGLRGATAQRAGSQAKPDEVLQGCWKFLASLREGWLESSNDVKLGVFTRWIIRGCGWSLSGSMTTSSSASGVDGSHRSPFGGYVDPRCGGKLVPVTSAADDHSAFCTGISIQCR